MKQNLMSLLLAVFVAVSLIGCVADKKTGRLSKIGKFYHNVTGHYNYYFNAREMIGISQKKLAETHKDNYNKILEMFREAAVESATSENGKFDDAIKRSKINIELHGKSDWADDSYLEIGKAQYLKKDYKDAAATFQFIINQFDPKKLALENGEAKKASKRKTVEKKVEPKKVVPKKSSKTKEVKRFTPKTDPKTDPKNLVKTDPNKAAGGKDTLKSVVVTAIGGDVLRRTEFGKKIKRRTFFLKHRPVREDAFLWLARTQIEMEHYDEAESLLRSLGNDYTLPKRLWKQLPEILAYSKLRQKIIRKPSKI